MMQHSSRASDAQTVIRSLQAESAKSRSVDREIRVSFRSSDGVIGRRDYATHWLHWYPAKMFHRIPSVFFDNVTLPDAAVVLDPFCGSGTVLLEANLRGHDAIGIDISPLAQLISQVKTTTLDPTQINAQMPEVLNKARRSRARPTTHNILDSWLPRESRIALHRLGLAISEISNPDIQAFFFITMTSIVRRISMADPSIPPLVHLRDDRAEVAGTRYRNALERLKSITVHSVYSAFGETAVANANRMSELYALKTKLGSTKIIAPNVEACQTSLEDNSVDAIVTSPPYCGAQKYVRSMKLELILAGSTKAQLRDLDRRTMGTEAVSTRRTPLPDLLTGDELVDEIVSQIYSVNPTRARMAKEYVEYLKAFAMECSRVLRPGGHLLITLGRSTLSGVVLPTDRLFHYFGRKLGLESVATLVDRIPSRGLITQRHKTAGRMDYEFLAWLQQPSSVQAS